MGPLAPAVAACRTALRSALLGQGHGDLVLVACSGGADSLALAAATAFVAPRAGLSAGLVCVDHGLQEGSGEQAKAVVRWAEQVGLAPALVVPVEVRGRPGGPEAAAREARYAALAEVAGAESAVAVLLGHTRDDQAETVLLALARGAGPRGLAGMPERRVMHGVPFLRPFLAVSREQTGSACAALGLTPWQDPHNTDPCYTRSRVRAAMPVLVRDLGAGLVANLARTAHLVAEDLAALDEIAASVGQAATDAEGFLRVPLLADLPTAIRTRVLRSFALRLGAPGGSLGTRHIEALQALVVRWHGQGPVALPGGILVARRGDRLRPVTPPGIPS